MKKIIINVALVIAAILVTFLVIMPVLSHIPS